MAVEIVAGPVVTHRGAWIGMAGSDLDIPEVHARVEHGRDEGRPTAGGSGTRTTLVPLPHTRSTR